MNAASRRAGIRPCDLVATVDVAHPGQGSNA